MFDPIEKDLLSSYKSLPITIWESPNFLTTRNEITNYFSLKKRYFMNDFYIFQRQRTGILMSNEKPLGGQYSFDEMNRKKLPKNTPFVMFYYTSNEPGLEAAKAWVKQQFPNNPGDVNDFNYPIDYAGANTLLEDFLQYKLHDFGPYQDAIDFTDPYQFHSNLSTALNVGLLSPRTIIDRVLAMDVPLASKEGFVRQILGWREYVRALYILEGDRLFESNALYHQNKLSDVWFSGVGLPVVDSCIQKMNRFGYLHHIERLMVIGNLMLMLNIHPKEVYRYFSIYFTDAYDWVMIPNIFGMSQFSAEGIMTTKPYFSGSNYLKKMGAKLGESAEIWDALFYLFIQDHYEVIQKNPRLSILIGLMDKITDEQWMKYRIIKDTWIKKTTVGDYHDKS
jgi:deoxyribodipyrimidine photolyase-related protein